MGLTKTRHHNNITHTIRVASLLLILDMPWRNLFNIFDISLFSLHSDRIHSTIQCRWASSGEAESAARCERRVPDIQHGRSFGEAEDQQQ